MEIKRTKGENKVEMMMTPMIDVVFQLLIFFMLSFKIAASEGDFNIKMPLAAPREGTPDPDKLPPVKVRLIADGGGMLSGITFNDQAVGDFRALRKKIMDNFGTDSGPGTNLAAAEIEFDCDYNLRYENVISAVSAVSGYVEDGKVFKLVEKIKFAPPRPGN